MKVRKVGRNDACPCGSGKKFKQCCERKFQRMAMTTRVIIIAVACALIGGLVFAVSSMTGESDLGPRRVWSPEHGHWH